MRTLVVIQHLVGERNDRTGETQKWTKFIAGWCAEKATPLGESAPNQQTQAKHLIEFTTHWTQTWSQVNAKMRAVAGGRVLPIRSVVNPAGLNREIMITCEETT